LLSFPQENQTFGITGIMSFRSRIEHFDFEVQKMLQGGQFIPLKIKNWGHVAPLKRCENYAIEKGLQPKPTVRYQLSQSGLSLVLAEF
jgi:hypothetical protein